ncbi:MAG: NAD(P)H-binding protein [Deltaproteobacteria bacterium]|nr:NAD(P)H-binding protein [Deltaproteobacteria bacterium]
MARTALVVGATGLVGREVVGELVASDRWSRVFVLARRTTGVAHAKLVEHTVDFETLADAPESASAAIQDVDDVFACLGTTIKVAGSEDRFRRVDHDYTVAAARLGHARGARRIGLVSSVGASESGTFYLRVKAETERDVRAIPFESVVIARPSFLVGERHEQRTGERVGIALASLVAPLMFGAARAYRPIAAADVARALVRAVGEGAPPRDRILTFEDLSRR